MMDWGWGGGAVGLLWMALFWAAVVALIVVAVRAIGGNPSGTESGPDARAVLAERFARGEISAEEYDERSRVLSAGRR